MRVLIVDDEETIADFIGECINIIDDEVDVDVRYCGEKARSLLGQNTYDLIFSDLEMPIVDGRGVMKSADSLPGKPPVFCFVTGHSKSIGKTLSYRGTLLLLPKPFQFKDIEGIIEKFCNKN